MFLDNKTKAVDQEEKNIKLQKIRIDIYTCIRILYNRIK